MLLLVGVHLRNNVVAAVAEVILAKLAIIPATVTALAVCRIDAYAQLRALRNSDLRADKCLSKVKASMRNGCCLLSGKGNLCTSSLRGLLGNNTCLKSGLVCLSVGSTSINQYLICRKQ